MTRAQFYEKYGHINVDFRSYYKFTFVFCADLEDGRHIRVSVGGDSDAIYRFEVESGELVAIDVLQPYSGEVWENGKQTDSFYDY